MNKDFDRWNGVKKVIDVAGGMSRAFPAVGEVWMVVLGVNVGREQDGDSAAFSRPVVVVKKFNNEMFWGVPLTTKQKSLDFYHNFTDPNGRPAAAIVAQLRLISIKRFERKMYTMSASCFTKICEMLHLFVPHRPSNRSPAQGGASRSPR